MAREQALNDTIQLVDMITKTSLDLVKKSKVKPLPLSNVEDVITYAASSICVMLGQLCKILAQQIPQKEQDVSELIVIEKAGGENEAQQG